MGSERELSQIVWTKIREQVDRTQNLLGRIPPDKIEWRPQPNTLALAEVLGHLLDCLAGFCATLYAAAPQRLDHFLELRERPVNHCCGIDEARERIAEYMHHLDEGFAVISDCDLGRRIPTVFVPEGETVLSVLLGNLEHFINHKFQLFFYLKMLGVSVGTPDLYCRRGPSTTEPARSRSTGGRNEG